MSSPSSVSSASPLMPDYSPSMYGLREPQLIHGDRLSEAAARLSPRNLDDRDIAVLSPDPETRDQTMGLVFIPVNNQLWNPDNKAISPNSSFSPPHLIAPIAVRTASAQYALLGTSQMDAARSDETISPDPEPDWYTQTPPPDAVDGEMEHRTWISSGRMYADCKGATISPDPEPDRYEPIPAPADEPPPDAVALEMENHEWLSNGDKQAWHRTTLPPHADDIPITIDWPRRIHVSKKLFSLPAKWRTAKTGRPDTPIRPLLAIHAYTRLLAIHAYNKAREEHIQQIQAFDEQTIRLEAAWKQLLTGAAPALI